MRNKLKRWTREWMRQRLKSDEELPSVDLNIGFRGMPEDFYKMLKHTDFDHVMARGWKQLVAQLKKPSPGQLIKPVIKPVAK